MEDLKSMSDVQLIESLQDQVQEERKITALVIRLLEEVDKRKLYLKMGFGSLIDFCIRELKYSESSAYRRVSAMRVCREVPQVEEKILNGTLSLSVLSQAQTFVRNEEKLKGQRMPTEVKQDLIQNLENKTSREAEKFLIEKSPQQTRPEKVRAISSDKSELRLTLDQATMENLEKIKSLISHKNPSANYSELIKLMSEMLLARMDPERNLERKRKAAPTPVFNKKEGLEIKAEFKSKAKEGLAKKAKLNSTVEKAEIGSKVEGNLLGKELGLLNWVINSESDRIAEGAAHAGHSRDVQESIFTENTRQTGNSSCTPNKMISKNQIKQQVWSKSKGQCCYIDGKSKRRCTSRFQLQMDHIVPKSKGGPDHPSNLQLLCREHNQWKGWSLRG